VQQIPGDYEISENAAIASQQSVAGRLLYRMILLIISALLTGLGVSLLVVYFYHLPTVENRLSWRLDAANVYVQGVLDPVEEPPTPISQHTLIYSPTATKTQLPTATPPPESPTDVSIVFTPTPTNIPSAVSLYSPESVSNIPHLLKLTHQLNFL
jgi:hypothetical protein